MRTVRNKAFFARGKKHQRRPDRATRYIPTCAAEHGVMFPNVMDGGGGMGGRAGRRGMGAALPAIGSGVYLRGPDWLRLAQIG